ncbi:DUF4003 family protein [Priestia megaterium]|uniref:DUF4003 family protein n=1 Tax=Priestia megaterium TaxID=1404 RepID=UPI002D800DEA|nr:DUF4003 family protein [Priestia megaterium]MEB4868546.1 DUF4003 family protein [Priestia megaterium]
MVPENIQQKINQYRDFYISLKNELKWKAADHKQFMAIASMYAVKGISLELQDYLELSDYIKNQVGMFSTLKSSQRFTIAAMLDTRYENPKETFHEFLDVYDQLIQGGFTRGAFTYIAASAMLSNESSRSHKEMIRRSAEIYQGMKRKHLFLTSSGDVPLAVLLAETSESTDDLMHEIEHFYTTLAQHGFKKGNDLQFLSHILSIDKNLDADTLIERCVSVKEACESAGMKVKAMHYPVIGLLALFEKPETEIELIHEVVKQLNADKLFKWQKDINVMLGVNLVISEKLKDSRVVETGIYTTVETIIQAQQAAMLAVIASTSAVATTTTT